MPSHAITPKAKGISVAAWYWQPVRWAGAIGVSAYYRTAYRIRGWGRLPRRRGASLIVINHQHEIESAVIVANLSLGALAWRYPIFTVSSRRMWEPDFLAQRVPWIRPAVRGLNFGPLFAAMGMQPIENELHSRPLISLAHTLHARHGDLPLGAVLRERALARVPGNVERLTDVLKPSAGAAAKAVVSLSDLLEPYRSAELRATRAQLEDDSAHFEQLVRDGASLFLAPEGFYSTDGKMQRLRGLLPRLAPLARVYLTGISYDPFVGRRLSMLYRVLPADEGVPFDVQLKRIRPVTTSALLAGWLLGLPAKATFSGDEAAQAVVRQLVELPRVLFVDPELRRSPARMVRCALQGMRRRNVLSGTDSGALSLTDKRRHPAFENTADVLAYQANFHAETLEGARSEFYRRAQP